MDDRHRGAGNGAAGQNPAYRPTHPLLRPLTCGFLSPDGRQSANSPWPARPVNLQSGSCPLRARARRERADDRCVRLLDAENGLVGQLTTIRKSQRQALEMARGVSVDVALPVESAGAGHRTGTAERSGARIAEQPGRSCRGRGEDHGGLGGRGFGGLLVRVGVGPGPGARLTPLVVADRARHRGPVRPPGRAHPAQQQGPGAGSYPAPDCARSTTWWRSRPGRCWCSPGPVCRCRRWTPVACQPAVVARRDSGRGRFR